MPPTLATSVFLALHKLHLTLTLFLYLSYTPLERVTARLANNQLNQSVLNKLA
jgi:hypothetical protein